jgi:hypothetical protein
MSGDAVIVNMQQRRNGKPRGNESRITRLPSVNAARNWTTIYAARFAMDHAGLRKHCGSGFTKRNQVPLWKGTKVILNQEETGNETENNQRGSRQEV